MAVFTPVMRTHEGNRPDTNFQYYEDEDCMGQLARLVDIYTMLAPYMKTLVKENAEKGIPVQRPLFLHHEEDKRAYAIQYEYLLGRDLLVAPVYLEARENWDVYLPEGEWVYLWTGDPYQGGDEMCIRDRVSWESMWAATRKRTRPCAPSFSIWEKM